MPVPTFRKHVIATFDNSNFGGDINTFSAVADMNGDGRPDLVVSGRSGRMAWFENPGIPGQPWTVHPISDVKNQECGGSLLDREMTLRYYRRRMWCEELHGDLKNHGFDLESSMLHDSLRLSRLTLAVAILYVCGRSRSALTRSIRAYATSLIATTVVI